MKQNFTLRNLNRLFAVMAIMLIGASAQSQSPDYSFTNPSLESGTAGNVNAVYRFPNVYKNNGTIDALVKIKQKVGNITLTNIDRTADGYQEAFQPQYSIGSLTNAYFVFEITFVQAGTGTGLMQNWVDVSALDIDGSNSGGLTLKEFNSVDMGRGYATFSTLNSELSVSQSGSEYTGANVTGVLYGALVDTAAKSVMFSVSSPYVTTFTFKVGSNSLLSNNSTRYASLYFKKFEYPQSMVLATNNLTSFSGSANAGKVSLKWTLSEENTVKNTILEKSADGRSFRFVSSFTTNGNSYFYNDNFSKEDGNNVFYRLKVVSQNGKAEYSNILKFSNENKGTNTFNVFPTLIRSEATITFQSPATEQATIFVTDMNGRIVKQDKVALEQGSNSIRLSGFDKFNKGAYAIAITTPEKREVKQIMIQ